MLGLIGESGAGKSTIGLAALAYGRGGCRIIGGEVLLDGKDILALGKAGVREHPRPPVSYVAQSAAAAFNPAHKLGDQVIEAAVRHGMMSRARRGQAGALALPRARPARSRNASATAIRTRSPAASCSAR